MKAAELTSTRAAIDDFLAHPRIAVVGVSRDERDFSRSVLRDLAAKGYDVLPVNPSAESIGGQHCYAHVGDIDPPPDGALVMTPSASSAEVVRECAAAGVSRVWLHRGAGRGAVSDEAIAVARASGLTVVSGQCPYMFLDGDHGPHRVHRWFKKIAGRYPQPACPATATVGAARERARPAIEVAPQVEPETRLWPLAAWTWLLMLAVTVAAGVLRALLIEPFVDAYAAHFLGSIIAATALVIVGGVSLRRVAGDQPTGKLLLVGLVWVAATMAFELLFFGVLLGQPFGPLLANYDLTQGRLWPVVLLVIFLTPLVARNWADSGE